MKNLSGKQNCTNSPDGKRIRRGRGKFIRCANCRRCGEDSRKLEEFWEKDIWCPSFMRSGMDQAPVHFFHEMKNMLAVLGGFLEMFSVNPDYQKDADKIQIMIRETDYLYQMTLNYLAFMQNPQFGSMWVDIGAAVTEICGVLQERAQAEDIVIQNRVRPGPKIWGNPLKIRQMVFNLLKNSLESMEQRGGCLWIETDIYRGHSRLVVADEGGGIPQELCQNPGSRVQSRKKHGSGVGLSFCCRVWEECRAKWQIETSECGSRIAVVFPLREELQKNFHEIHVIHQKSMVQ